MVLTGLPPDFGRACDDSFGLDWGQAEELDSNCVWCMSCSCCFVFLPALKYIIDSWPCFPFWPSSFSCSLVDVKKAPQAQRPSRNFPMSGTRQFSRRDQPRSSHSDAELLRQVESFLVDLSIPLRCLERRLSRIFCPSFLATNKLNPKVHHHFPYHHSFFF